jgi:hypothetical protein
MCTVAKHAKTLALIATAREILEEGHPMTLRQVFYQLVSRQVIENTRGQYQAVSNALVDARKDGTIPWDWMEDRLRQPRCVSMWENIGDFISDMLWSFKLDIWKGQPGYVEVWLEKDALSGIFEDVLRRFRVTLNVGRGYDGWDSIHNAARRYKSHWTGQGLQVWHKPITILYFGDFDPSGEDMARSLKERLAFFGCHPDILKCALTHDDVIRYNLPPDFTKKTDTRSKAFVEKYGDVAVELDALPVDVLRTRLAEEVRTRIDKPLMDAVLRVEQQEGNRLEKLLR